MRAFVNSTGYTILIEGFKTKLWFDVANNCHCFYRKIARQGYLAARASVHCLLVLLVWHNKKKKKARDPSQNQQTQNKSFRAPPPLLGFFFLWQIRPSLHALIVLGNLLLYIKVLTCNQNEHLSTICGIPKHFFIGEIASLFCAALFLLPPLLASGCCLFLFFGRGLLLGRENWVFPPASWKYSAYSIFCPWNHFLFFFFVFCPIFGSNDKFHLLPQLAVWYTKDRTHPIFPPLLPFAEREKGREGTDVSHKPFPIITPRGLTSILLRESWSKYRFITHWCCSCCCCCCCCCCCYCALHYCWCFSCYCLRCCYWWSQQWKKYSCFSPFA